MVDESSPLMCKDFKDFLSGIGIHHRAISGQAHGPHGTAEGHIKTMRRTMAKLTAEFPELSPATILSLAVMGHNNGESVRGFSPFQWSYGKGYEPGDYADRHFMGLDDGSASEFARRQGLRDAAELCADGPLPLLGNR